MKPNKPVMGKRKPNIIPIALDATFFYERAVQSMDRHRYDRALKYFRRAAEYEPENPVNHCNLAGVLSELGDYGESNKILQHILDQLDASMTECYFYMANNYANMDDFEGAEQALIRYLEQDPDGHYLDEAEEMMEFLSYELERPMAITSIKAREGFVEHDKARALLEEGKFAEAVGVLETLVESMPEFLAARNNLALAYYYMGQFRKAETTILEVLELEPGNLHGLCNLAIFCQHYGDRERLEELTALLRKMLPFQQDQLFKLATTMGILSEHEAAYGLFRRLLKQGNGRAEPCLYHYAAVAAYNIGRLPEAEKLWHQAGKADSSSPTSAYYLAKLELPANERPGKVSYHYHLPLEEQLKGLEKASSEVLPEHMQRDPLVRSSLFWALRHGDAETKMQVIQAFGLIADQEVELALRDFLMDPEQDDALKKVAVYVLRSMKVSDPLQVVIGGEPIVVRTKPISAKLPEWRDRWQEILELAQEHMRRRYDVVQQHDAETLWVEFLSRTYPNVPKMVKPDGWAAALEYWTAKMHRRRLTYHDVAVRYGVSITTVSRNAKLIDEACCLREKIKAIFVRWEDSDQE